MNHEEFKTSCTKAWGKIAKIDEKMDQFLARQYAKLKDDPTDEDNHKIAVLCAKTFDPILLRLVIHLAKLLAHFNVLFGLELLIDKETGSIGWAPENDPLNLIGSQNDPVFQDLYHELIGLLSASCIGVALGPQVAELLSNYTNAEDGETDGHESN